MLASAFRYNGGMKNAARRRIVAVLTAGILAFSAAPAWAKSAKEVFAEVAGSVVVVLALDSSGETQAQGSGVVVGKNEVATNCHVIDKAKSVVVHQAADSGGDESYRMDARILARNDERDLCLLFVDALSEPPAAPVAEMGAAEALTVGEEVFAIGAPEGWELSLSRGVVSQLRKIHGKHDAPLVQTDAAISPGSSGGGLFNENGELVGITTFKWKGESLNFAIPAEWVGELLTQDGTEVAVEEKSTSIHKLDVTGADPAESNLPPPRWYFGAKEEGEKWLTEMSSRLQQILPESSPYYQNAKMRRDLLKSIHYEGTRAGLDPQLILAVIHQGSAFRKYAISTAGARGLMQVMPFWVDLIGDKNDNLFDTRTNLRYGVTILRHYLLDREKGDTFRALGRYNGSVGKARYPRDVYSKLKRYWEY